MAIQSTERTERIKAEAKQVTYVKAARWGKYRWWRYLLGLMIILFAWMVVANVATALVAIALDGQEGFAAFSRLDYAAFGSIWGFSDLTTFALFVPIALILTAIQTTTEELFFRGYIVQGASLLWSNRVFLAIVSAVIFTLPHAANPESQEGGWIGMFLGLFVGTGLLYALVSLIDGTTELAIGAHFANNIAYFLLFNWSGSFFTTPALFSISEYHARFYDITSLVLIPVFLVIVFRVFKHDKASEPVSQSHRKGGQ